MSKIIASAAIRGAYKRAKQAEDILTRAVKEKGEDCPVEFPNTGYYMPIIYSMTGKAVEKLADFEEVMKQIKTYCRRRLTMIFGCLIWVMPLMPVWRRFLQKRSSRRANI